MSTGPPHDISSGRLLPFSVDCSRSQAGLLIAAISGDLDIATAETLVGAVASRADADPSRGVVLDFTDVDFMDSTGLRAILEIARCLDDHDAGLVLMSPGNSVRKLLSLAGLDDRFPVAGSLEQAEAFLAAPGTPASG